MQDWHGSGHVAAAFRDLAEMSALCFCAWRRIQKKKQNCVAVSFPASKVLVVTQQLIKSIHKLTGLLLTGKHQAPASFNELLELVAAEGLDGETQTDQSALCKRAQPDLIWSRGGEHAELLASGAPLQPDFIGEPSSGSAAQRAFVLCLRVE